MHAPEASPEASLGVRSGFIVLALLVALLFVVGNFVAAKRLGSDVRAAHQIAVRMLAGSALWMMLTWMAAKTGELARFDAKPPPLAGIFIAVLAVSCAIGFGRIGARLARGLPLVALVAVQGFRLPLELVMHEASLEGVMPVQMSFAGWNFDIVSGFTAIALAVLLALGRAPRALVVAWNALGALLLAVILAIALLSTPMIHAFGREPRALNTFVAHVPFVWLPCVLVVAALAGHIIVARRLVSSGSRSL